MALRISDKELQSIVSEVEETLLKMTNDAKATLAKADGEMTHEETPGEEGSPEGSAPTPEGSAPAPEGSAPAPEGSAPAPEGSAPEGSPQADPAVDGAGADDAADPAALVEAYKQLPPEVLMAHFEACKAAVGELTGGATAPGEGSAPPVAPAGPAGAPPPALKGEMNAHAKANGGQTVPVKKSEADRAVTEKLALLEEQNQTLAKALDLLINRPERKAVTTVTAMGKPGAVAEVAKMSKTEATQKLNEVARNPKLKKSDRDRINAFVVGEITIDSVKDLLQ